ATAVVRQGRDRADDVVDAALVGAVVAFETPQRDHHRRRHPGALLDAGQQRRVGFELLQPVLVAAGPGHAAGELQEALLEHPCPLSRRMMAGSKVTPSSAAAMAWREMPAAAASCLKSASHFSKLPVLRQRGAASAGPHNT